MNTLALLASLALSAFLSATLLPGSSEILLAGMLTEGSVQPWLLLAVVTLANTAGSLVNWWLGTNVQHFANRRWFPIAPQKLENAQDWFQRFGKWSLLLSPVPIIGDALTLAAGVMRTNIAHFVMIVGMAKAVRYALIYLGVVALF